MASTCLAACPLSLLERMPASLHRLLRSFLGFGDHLHLAEVSQTLYPEHGDFFGYYSIVHWCSYKDPAALSSLLRRQTSVRLLRIPGVLGGSLRGRLQGSLSEASGAGYQH